MYKCRCKQKMVAYPQKTKTICNKCIMGKSENKMLVIACSMCSNVDETSKIWFSFSNMDGVAYYKRFTFNVLKDWERERDSL